MPMEIGSARCMPNVGKTYGKCLVRAAGGFVSWFALEVADLLTYCE